MISQTIIMIINQYKWQFILVIIFPNSQHHATRPIHPSRALALHRVSQLQRLALRSQNLSPSHYSQLTPAIKHQLNKNAVGVVIRSANDDNVHKVTNMLVRQSSTEYGLQLPKTKTNSNNYGIVN